MPNYKRAFIPGGTWFFTVNLLERRHKDLLVRDYRVATKCSTKGKTEISFSYRCMGCVNRAYALYIEFTGK